MTIPSELKMSVEGFDNPIRWNIVEALCNNNELSYSELLSKARISNGQLTYHLNMMQKSGLVEQFTKGRFERGSSFYSLSPVARSMVRGMIRALNPIVRQFSFVDPTPIVMIAGPQYPTYKKFMGF
jgi:DNA-binding HxlR family transcriptional regulator